MREAQEVYDEYKIMPSLQSHQLRVAAIAKLICDNFSPGGGSSSGGQKPVDKKTVVTACLFHDMGNIIKSDLTRFPMFSDSEGVEYWESVKKEFIVKYGDDSHVANVRIAKEIGLAPNVTEIINGIGFSKMEKILFEGSWELKIAEYADTRVSPTGILPLEERIREGKTRYQARAKKDDLPDRDHIFDSALEAARKLEGIIFANTQIIAIDIDDGAVEPLIGELRNYRID